MPVLYFDNFRGFNKTFLPLKSVNFFVGENSSGKTSILKLIKTLSENQFWFTQDFNLDGIDLGYFSEIATQTNQVNNYFEVGILEDLHNEDKWLNAVKLKFESKGGIPSIKEICLINFDLNIQISFDENVKYRYSTIGPQNLSNTKRLFYFMEWVKDNGLGKLSFVDEEAKILFSRGSVFHIQHILSQIQPSNQELKRSKFFLPVFDTFQDFAWLAPIRTDPKRTYDSYKTSFNPDGTHAPYLLKNLLGKDNPPENREKIEMILRKFGENSGLFDTLLINPLGEGDTSPFELQVILNGRPLKITNVGYGVSQILPLVIEIIARKPKTWFALQQPEIHLHPRGQAAFGEFIFNSAKDDNKNFIIETHSDYMIDRFRLKLHQDHQITQVKSLESQIIFFHRSNGVNKLTCIPILPDGSLPEDQPKEFRDFFIKEQLNLLEI